MEIIPNSTIILLHNVPLESNYENTIYWTHDQVYGVNKEQETYFKRFQVKKFENQYYQRKDKGSLKLECKMESIYDCNYMMFKNTSFENKWFYAFVDRIEYINNITCAIYYTIDIMQTYIGDYELNNCFVEREHSATDVAGDNILNENLELGQYIIKEFKTTKDYDVLGLTGTKADLSPDKILIVAPFKYDSTQSIQTNRFEDNDCIKKNGVTSGLYYNLLNNDKSTLDQFFEDSEATLFRSRNERYRVNEIVSMSAVPSLLMSRVTEDNNARLSIMIPKENTSSSTIDNYHPKNKKLLTYPYNFMYVTNFQGTSAIFPYEYFKDQYNCYLALIGDMSAEPSVMLVPYNFKGDNGQLATLGLLNYDEKITLGNYPTIGYTIDTYKQYVAQHGVSTAISLLSSLGGIALTTATGGASMLASNALQMASLNNMGIKNFATASNLIAPTLEAQRTSRIGFNVGQGISAFSTVANTLAQYTEASMMPNQAKGQSSGTLLAGSQLFNFGIIKKQIRSDYARIIDGYFTMFGYATKRNKFPNRNVRNNCTYLKTNGCTINGSVPAEDERAICDIHDNGIRYWNGTNVYNNSVQVAKYLEDDNEYITNAILS